MCSIQYMSFLRSLLIRSYRLSCPIDPHPLFLNTGVKNNIWIELIFFNMLLEHIRSLIAFRLSSWPNWLAWDLACICATLFLSSRQDAYVHQERLTKETYKRDLYAEILKETYKRDLQHAYARHSSYLSHAGSQVWKTLYYSQNLNPTLP